MDAIIRVPEIQAEPLGVSVSAREAMDKLIAACRLVIRVVNDRTQATAARTAVEARTELKRIEEARVAVKAPALELCRRIDEIAREASTPIKAEVVRIEKLLTEYQRELDNIRREQERLALEEQQRKQREANEEAERIRKAALAAAQATQNPVAAQQVLDLAAARAKEVQASVPVPSAVVPAPTTMASGMRKREVWSYRVTDVWKLAAHDRNLVRIEPYPMAIREKIANGMRECPGLEIFEETKVGTAAR